MGFFISYRLQTSQVFETWEVYPLTLRPTSPEEDRFREQQDLTNTHIGLPPRNVPFVPGRNGVGIEPVHDNSVKQSFEIDFTKLALPFLAGKPYHEESQHLPRMGFQPNP